MFHILVVEDNANTRKLMEAVLTQHGYQPILARDGVEALDVLDRKHVDLIVLDIMMPRMDGYEFTRTLRESGCELPILMVTAKEKPADKHKGFLIGTTTTWSSPWTRRRWCFASPRCCAEAASSTSTGSPSGTRCWITTPCR